MKRIIIIFAALALLMSACINPIPPPSNDLDPVVVLSAPSSATLGQPVTINASVTDDTGGELEYTWTTHGFMRAGSGQSGGFGSGRFLLSYQAPAVENGWILGPEVTYRFDGGYVPFGEERITLYNEHDVLVRSGQVIDLVAGETVTLMNDGFTTSITFYGGMSAGDDVLTSVRFTAGDDTIDLEAGTPQVVELAGYAATLELLNHSLDASREIATVTVQATYTHEGLTQQQQVLLTPTSGVRITMPEGESVEAYLVGGTFATRLESVTIDVMGEQRVLSIGDVAVLEGTPVYVVSGSGTEGVQEDARVQLHVGGTIAKFGETIISVVEPEGIRTVLADVTINENTVTVQHDKGPVADVFEDPILGLYEYRLLNDKLYYVNRFTVDVLHVGDYLRIMPKSRTSEFAVSLTVTDERGNSGTDNLTFSVE